MIVLSCFDGMSNGQIALKELGIPVGKYYASEIDRFAIHNTQFNFPDTVQLGDVTKWREWDIPWGKIDLLLAGSPCQDVSMAGRMEGLKDGTRSNLFFTWVDILRHVQTLNPDVKFLLENVKMKKEFLRHFNETLGLYPVLINSALVSAQNRSRYYWTNIRTRWEGLFGELHTDIPQPKDKGLLLKDILDKDVPEKYYLKDEVLKKMLEANKRKAADGLTGFMTTPPHAGEQDGHAVRKGYMASGPYKGVFRTCPQAHSPRVLQVADRARMVQVGRFRDAAIQDARQRMDGGCHKAYTLIHGLSVKR